MKPLQHLTACVFLAIAAGCTMLNVAVPPAPDAPRAHHLKPGDLVDVTLKSGEVLRFRLSATGPNYLEGEPGRIAHADIQEVQVRRLSGSQIGKGAAALIIAVETALLVVVAAIFT